VLAEQQRQQRRERSNHSDQERDHECIVASSSPQTPGLGYSSSWS